MQNSCSNETPVYAGFWVRLAAFAIDHALILIPLLIANLIISGMLSIFDGTFLGGNVLFQYTLSDIISYLLQALYFIACTYMTGTTLGKRLMNLQVISANEDGKLTLTDVIFRETIGRFLCGVSMSIGYILIGLDSQKRGFHDMLSDTRVVYAKKVKVYPVYQGGVQGVPVQPVPVQNESEEAKGKQEQPEQFGYVPVQVDPAPTYGQSTAQVTEGTYFQVPENELPGEDKTKPREAEESSESQTEE